MKELIDWLLTAMEVYQTCENKDEFDRLIDAHMARLKSMMVPVG